MKKICFAALLLPLAVFAADADYTLVIRDHRFNPARLTVPAGKKIKLLIENQDAAPEEFESYALNREKIIAGHGKGNVYIGPLEPGRYSFVGEFNETTARGEIVAQ